MVAWQNSPSTATPITAANLIAAFTEKADAVATAASLVLKLDATTAATTYVPLTDARLTDARTPIAHTQTASTITDFSAAADARIALAPTTPGLSLVTPVSVAGTGVTLTGRSIALASASSASVNGCFTTVYDNYKIVIDLSASSAAADLNLLMRVGGVNLTASQYLGFQISMSSATPSYGYQAAGNTGLICGRTNGTGGSGVTVELMGPKLAEYTKMSTPMNMDAAIGRISGGTVGNTTQYDGFTLTSGSITMTGKIRVYGYNNG